MVNSYAFEAGEFGEAAAAARDVLSHARDHRAYPPDIDYAVDKAQQRIILSFCLSRAGRHDEAVAMIRQALRPSDVLPALLRPNASHALMRSARALAEGGRPTSALAAVQDAVTMKTSRTKSSSEASPCFPAMFDVLADLSRRLGRHEEARAAEARAERLRSEMKPDAYCDNCWVTTASPS